jgi:hypothetical protein
MKITGFSALPFDVRFLSEANEHLAFASEHMFSSRFSTPEMAKRFAKNKSVLP